MCYAIVILPVGFYAVVCFISRNSDLQLKLAFWFSMAFAFIMASVMIGMIITGVRCPINPAFLFMMTLVGVNIVAALLHFDIKSLVCGVVYFLFIPSCFIFLQIYSIANLDDVSWGTRQNKKRKDENNAESEDETSDSACCGLFECGCFKACTCVICLPKNHQVKPARIKERSSRSKVRPTFLMKY